MDKQSVKMLRQELNQEQKQEQKLQQKQEQLQRLIVNHPSLIAWVREKEEERTIYEYEDGQIIKKIKNINEYSEEETLDVFDYINRNKG
jgi:septal ring factor EnvC (AmiA/AmiB activator)